MMSRSSRFVPFWQGAVWLFNGFRWYEAIFLKFYCGKTSLNEVLLPAE